MWLSKRAERRRRREIDRLLAELDATTDWSDPWAQHLSMPGTRPTRTLSVHPAIAGIVVVLCLVLPAYLYSVLHHPAPIGDGSSYAFLMTQPGTNRPVSYDPCRPVTYAINTSGASAEEVAVVREASNEVAATSGFSVQYVGETSLRPFAAGPSVQVAEVIVGFATPQEVPGLAGDIAGEGGSRSDGAFPAVRYAEGDIALDRDLFATLMTQNRGPVSAKAIVMHEWGHVLGLDHVKDATQLMYSDNIGQTTWGAGDLAGLKVLADNPCG